MQESDRRSIEKHPDNVVEAVRFLDGEGKLLDPYLAEVLRKQIQQFIKHDEVLRQRGWLFNAVLPSSYTARGERNNLRQQIEIKLDAFRNMVAMFESIESLPRAATEMAKWGAEELILPFLKPALEGDSDADDAFVSNREIWFKGLERMMRASQAWRMLLQANEKINNGNGSTIALGGLETKQKFVTAVYALMDSKNSPAFADFKKLIDQFFVPEGLEPFYRTAKLVSVKAMLMGKSKKISPTDAAIQFAQEHGVRAQNDGLTDPNPETEVNEVYDPLFYEYLWMVVNGETTPYMLGLSKQLKEAGRRADASEADMFQPKIWLGPATESDVTVNRATEVGEMLRVDFSTTASDNDWMDARLNDIAVDTALENEKKPEQEGAIWLAIEVDLNEVLGPNSAFAWYIKTIGAVEKPLLQLGVPISISEAKILIKSPQQKNPDEIRRAIIDAWINRDVGALLWHGFGAEDEVFMTSGWASTAFNTLIPDGTGAHGQRITKEALQQGELAACLKGRLTGGILNVLGSRETGTEVEGKQGHLDSAGSMERAAWYVLEMSRALGLLPGQFEKILTIMYGHSMGGQIALRVRAGLLPETVRDKVHIIAATPVSTASHKIDTFLHEGLNVLAKIVISTRPGNFGEILAKLGELMHIDAKIIKDMIRPKDNKPYGVDLHETTSVEHSHRKTYKNAVAYLKNQMKNISESNQAFAQRVIDELLVTSGVAGGDNLTILIGWLDKVLDPKLMLKNFDDHELVYQKQLDLLVNDWLAILQSWMQQQATAKRDCKLPEIIIGKFAHYLNVNKTGRDTLGAVFAGLVRKYGFE